MEDRTLEFTHDMPVVPVLPGEHVRIRSAISLPGSDGTAFVSLHLIPFQNDVYPGQWFHGFRLDVEAHQLRHDVHSEVLSVARQQAAVISEKLQIAHCGFAQAHV